MNKTLTKEGRNTKMCTISTDTVNRANEMSMRRESVRMNEYANNRGEIHVSIRCGNNTFSETISMDKIQQAYRNAYNSVRSNGKGL